MHLDFLYSPNLLLALLACLAMLLLSLCNFMTSQSLTRPVVIALGLCFIGLGVYGHVKFLDMLETCRELVAAGRVSESTLSRLERYHLVFAYMLPFVSAAIGTNVVSDALLKHHTYQRSFSTSRFIRDLGQVILIPVGIVIAAVVGVVCLVLSPVAPARRLLSSVFPRVWRWTYLRVLKVSIIARYKIRSTRQTVGNRDGGVGAG